MYEVEYRNAQMLENNNIKCEILHPRHGWIPFTCDPNDTESIVDTRYFYYKMLSSGKVAPYQEPSEEEMSIKKQEEVREIRNGFLVMEVDPIVTNPLRWEEMSEDDKNAMRNYRKLLLDVPLQEGFPYDVEWPSKPIFLLK